MLAESGTDTESLLDMLSASFGWAAIELNELIDPKQRSRALGFHAEERPDEKPNLHTLRDIEVNKAESVAKARYPPPPLLLPPPQPQPPSLPLQPPLPQTDQPAIDWT